MAYHIRAIIAVLTCSLAVGPLVADEPADKAKELEKRVAQLEQRVAELTKQVDRLEKALAEREGRVGTTIQVGQDFPSALAALKTAGAKPRKEGELFVTELIISGARNPMWCVTSQWLLPDNTAVILYPSPKKGVVPEKGKADALGRVPPKIDAKEQVVGAISLGKSGKGWEGGFDGKQAVELAKSK